MLLLSNSRKFQWKVWKLALEILLVFSASLTINIASVSANGVDLSPSPSVGLCVCVCCVTFALLPFHSVCLSGCLSVIPRPTAYHDWSITTKFGRQVCTCPRTRVSLFGSPISHTFGARGKICKNFVYCVFLPLRTWRIVPYDLYLCLSAPFFSDVNAVRGQRTFR